jgi:hypothetical protein
MTKELQTQNFSGQTNNDLAIIEQSREIAQVQAQHIVAKKFPRDENLVFQKIMKQCQRKSMAEVAMYSYPKGGQNVTGPSIRLAELLANGFGNLEYGIRVLNQDSTKVEAMAYCIDLENNTRKVDYFTVRLEIGTKKGPKKLTDARDVYEHTQSQGARRVRGCIIAIIPGDIVEAAINQCETTLNSDEEPIQAKIQKLITAFTTYNVTVENIEKRMGKSINALNNQDILSLRKIYQSLKDGMASIDSFFDVKTKVETASMSVASLKAPANELVIETPKATDQEPVQTDIEDHIDPEAEPIEEVDQSDAIFKKHEDAIKSYKNEKSLNAHFNYLSTKQDLECLQKNNPVLFSQINLLRNNQLEMINHDK